jgi:hypothetical protein
MIYNKNSQICIINGRCCHEQDRERKREEKSQDSTQRNQNEIFELVGKFRNSKHNMPHQKAVQPQTTQLLCYNETSSSENRISQTNMIYRSLSRGKSLMVPCLSTL